MSPDLRARSIWVFFLVGPSKMMFGLPWAVPLGGSVIAQSSPGPPHRFSCEGLRGEKLDAESQDPSCVCCLGNAHPHVDCLRMSLGGCSFKTDWAQVLFKCVTLAAKSILRPQNQLAPLSTQLSSISSIWVSLSANQGPPSRSPPKKQKNK